MDRTLSTIQHIIQRSRERKALPLAPTEADNCYLSGRFNEADRHPDSGREDSWLSVTAEGVAELLLVHA